MPETLNNGLKIIQLQMKKRSFELAGVFLFAILIVGSVTANAADWTITRNQPTAMTACVMPIAVCAKRSLTAIQIYIESEKYMLSSTVNYPATQSKKEK